jgi:hypothetical protein
MTHATTELERDLPLVYMETTIPAGQTIGDYRRSRPQRPSRWERLKRLAGHVGVAASTTLAAEPA